MSSPNYCKLYPLMTDEQKDAMDDLYMEGINHDGHVWVTYSQVEEMVCRILEPLMRKDDEA